MGQLLELYPLLSLKLAFSGLLNEFSLVYLFSRSLDFSPSCFSLSSLPSILNVFSYFSSLCFYWGFRRSRINTSILSTAVTQNSVTFSASIAWFCSKNGEMLWCLSLRKYGQHLLKWWQMLEVGTAAYESLRWRQKSLERRSKRDVLGLPIKAWLPLSVPRKSEKCMHPARKKPLWECSVGNPASMWKGASPQLLET